MSSQTAQFDVDAGSPPYTRNYALWPVNDTPAVELVVAGFLPGDVIQQVTFTAKLSPADADNAPTTVQHTWQPPNGSTGPQVTPTNAGGASYAIMIPLTQADSVILQTAHGYDVRIWVLRGGVTVVRTVQSGQVVTYVGMTGLSAPVGGGMEDEDATLLVDEGYA